MKKIFVAILLAVVTLVVTIIPVYAGVDISGVFYNFSAAANQNVLTIVWGDPQKPNLNFHGDQFVLTGSKKTIAAIESAIETSVNDITVTKENLNQLPVDDPARQTPPVLLPGQFIVANQIWTYTVFFKIHIYSLDDIATPQSELRFVTIFADPRAFPDGIPDNWWGS